MTDSDDEPQQRHLAFLEEVRQQRESPWWRPGAMPPEERERLVRIGLGIVLGDRAHEVEVVRNDEDTIEVAERGRSFGFPIDTVLGDDPRSVFEHDVDRLIDELCEFDVAWAEHLPECPVHPDSHPLTVAFTESTIIATCPASGTTIRWVSY